MDYKTEKIRAEIERQYGSIRKFAEFSGIPSTTITSALKKGVGGTSVDTVIKICEILNIDVTMLGSKQTPLVTCNDNIINVFQIGQRIKEKRKELCMTQPELAAKVGLSVASVSKYENGKVEDATTTKFVEFADALGVSPAYLMGWSDDVNGSPIESGDFIVSNGQVIEYDKLNDENKRKLEDYYRLLMMEQISKEGDI